ncbi:disease resistance protein RUN1-like [Jatropha curcas]|uniref:disease resistance protein RUN1-like n=1 Tax=Jatropha curcas TaxID=180498 RepID=UPI0018954BB6|nr:disease resistance protein RUN1-like [Jatropha curcas]
MRFWIHSNNVFDGLEETERNKYYPDIACFFKGKNKDHVTKILDSCGFYPDIGIRVLIDKSLITIVGERLWMHDLLQEMGWKLVRQESPKEPGKRSRLWLFEDIFHVMSKNTGTEDVEGLVLELPDPKENQLSAKAFSKMKNLRLLIFHNLHFSQNLEYLSSELRFLEWHGYPCKTFPPTFQSKQLVLELPDPKENQLSAKAFSKMKNLRLLIFHNLHFSQSLEYLSSELRYLEWHGYPCKTFPPTFQSKQLVELNLCFSQVEQLWDGIKQLNNLKVMKLSHSRNLVKTPDFRGVPNLEELILEGCTRLYEIDRSIGVLQTLVLLNLKDCKRLVSLPEGHVECLEELDISGTAIKQTSHSSFHFKNLKNLSLNGCNGQSKPLLSILPGKSSHSSAFCSLMALDLSNCNLQEETVPKNLGCLSSLREILFSGNDFISLPACIIGLSNLQRLYLDNCRKLESLRPFPSNVQHISAHGCSSLETLPEDLDTPSLQSQQLNFANCFKLSRNQGDNNLVFMMLRRYLQGLSNPKPGFDIVFPGSNVPKWFSHQSSGDSSARFELPPICSESKWMGFALCAIFLIHNRSAPRFLELALGCILKIKGHTWRHQLEDGFLTSMEQFGSDQLWLFYLSRHEFSEIDWHETTKMSCHVEVMFAAHGIGFYVKKFGVRLVYEQDVLEFNRTSNQFRISNYENCDAAHQVHDISEMDGALVKRSYSDHIKSDEAESSGISNLDIERETKRMKEID